MTATDELRRLLDERGVEWKEHKHQLAGSMALQLETLWGQPVDNTSGKQMQHVYHYRATEMGDGRLFLEAQLTTPEQAIAATLGPREQPPYDRLIELLAREWGIEASWDGLRRFWYVGWTDERVMAIGELHDELRDAIVEILGERCDWDQQGVSHAHEVIEKAATLGSGTCRDMPYDVYLELFDAVDGLGVEIENLQAENAKLRELCKDMMAFVEDDDACEHCGHDAECVEAADGELVLPYEGRCLMLDLFADRMRELRIEVDE